MSVPRIHLAFPPDWEATSELRIVEPPQSTLAVPLAGKGAGKRSGASLTVARGVTGAKSADEALEVFLKHFAEYASGLKRSDAIDVKFDDGTAGRSATLSYEAEPGVRVAQRHVYRMDGEVVTHLTASILERDADRLGADLWALMKTFHP
jgi:hypothetical protein